ncbi:nuclear transport factor 2 family protein [Maribacter sp. BPC-D8]|uniref:YybH family protein n=1 Tax=Maribacter sp. BPC-D8 TaxID=3053613 RepID=UPI002B47A9E2|nr:nuclear transport factor 2 family protein [Maribacter sp. BPC-D8]WRI30552.1 nuclear transport factor 2 family protein [Maribacter sp. BPC-D8]
MLVVISCDDNDNGNNSEDINDFATTPEEVVEKLEMYINAQNMNGVLSLYNGAAVFVDQPEGAPKVGFSAIREGYQGFFDLGGQSDIQIRNVIQSGNLALVIVDWTFSGIDSDGNSFEFGATGTDVLQQDEGGNYWLYSIDNAFGVARPDSNTGFTQAENSAASTAELEVLVENLEMYINTRNMDGILSLYNEEAVFVDQPEGEPKVGFDAIREGYQGFFDLGGQSDIQVRNVIQSGNIALVIVDWTYTGIDSDGNSFEFGATGTDVLQQGEDGNWLYRIDNAFGIARAN